MGFDMNMLRGLCWIRVFVFGVSFLICFFNVASQEDKNEYLLSTSDGLPTVTVRGFLNFKTTVDGTVIVFTPAQEVHPPTNQPKITKTSSTPVLQTSSQNDALLQENNFNNNKEISLDVQDIAYASSPQNSLEPVKTQSSYQNMLDEKMNDLQQISENAVVPSTGQIDTVFDKVKKNPSNNQYPTGLVTVLGGTTIGDKSTTVFETKVIGTYIDGKYAQILQSTSHIVASPVTASAPKLSFSGSENEQSGQLSKILFKNSEKYALSENIPRSSTSRYRIETSIVPSQPSSSLMSSSNILHTSKTINNRENESMKIKDPLLSYSTKQYNHFQARSSLVQLQSSFPSPSVSSSVNSKKATDSLETVFRTKSVENYSLFIPTTSTVVSYADYENTVSSNFKHSRTNSTSRTRFQSLRRPSQSVKLNRFKIKLTLRQDSPEEYNASSPSEDDDIEEEILNKSEDEIEPMTEGLGVDPAKVIFQETTITSEVTLHVGRRKSIRTLTITTSVPLTVNPSDIHDIIMSESSAMDRAGQDTDVLNHVVTRTYTTTERALKTSIVPIFDGKSTIYHSVTESFFIMKIITAYRTLPSGDVSVIESALEDPEVSESTLEAAANIQPSVTESLLPQQLQTTNLQPSIDVSKYQEARPPVLNPFLSLGHALSNNPLAAVYLGLQQLNAQMTLYSTLTDTSSYTTTHTIYSTKTIKLYDGRSTRSRIVSEPISTKKTIITTTVTSVQPYLNTLALQKQQQLQNLMAATQMRPTEPQYSTRTSILTTVTTTTSFSTRIYTLIYNGFSTKFRTVTSTSVYPTTATITSTVKVPLTPSQANVPFMYPYS